MATLANRECEESECHDQLSSELHSSLRCVSLRPAWMVLLALMGEWESALVKGVNLFQLKLEDKKKLLKEKKSQIACA